MRHICLVALMLLLGAPSNASFALGGIEDASPAQASSPQTAVTRLNGPPFASGVRRIALGNSIVGALRNEKSRRPAEILSNLNGVLHGQIQGFVTCCACLIDSGEIMTIANAGHIPPYRNGAELGIPGDVPLGILPDVKYEEHCVQLGLGDRLTFVSDGVVEAMNPNRELFGFDRTQQISNQSATAIASAAQAFGQHDDITVLRVVLNAVATPTPTA